MIDVIYTLTNRSKSRDDFELRYSLRSLEVQPWVRDVYCVGHCPDWFLGNHVECPDPYNISKDANIINKIMLMCSKKEISQKFVVNSDDQYFLEVIDPEILENPPLDPPVRRGTYYGRGNGNSWHSRVVSTVDWCANNGYMDTIYDSHRPYMVDKELYIDALSRVAWGWGNGFTTHVYFNIIGAIPGRDSGKTERIKGPMMFKDIKKVCSGATFLNHNDSGLTPDMRKYLQEKFPTPSRWEK